MADFLVMFGLWYLPLTTVSAFSALWVCLLRCRSHQFSDSVLIRVWQRRTVIFWRYWAGINLEVTSLRSWSHSVFLSQNRPTPNPYVCACAHQCSLWNSWQAPMVLSLPLFSLRLSCGPQSRELLPGEKKPSVYNIICFSARSRIFVS